MPLVDFYINPSTGDLDLTNNQLRLTQNVQECVRQKVAITLRGFRGEWKFNLNAYVPWIENENNPTAILGKEGRALFDTTIQSAILGVEGIQEILSYNSDWNKLTGNIDVEGTARTSSGDVITFLTSEG